MTLNRSSCSHSHGMFHCPIAALTTCCPVYSYDYNCPNTVVPCDFRPQMFVSLFYCSCCGNENGVLLHM